MKKILLMAAMSGILLTGCNTDTKDSTSTISFGEYNLIVSDNPSEPAQASPCIYSLKFNLTQGLVAMSTDNLLFNNKNHSFETGDMEYQSAYLTDGTNYVAQTSFSSASNIGTGASITNLKASFAANSYYCNDLIIPGYYTVPGVGSRLLMSYIYDETTRVQTFWPECFYRGYTTVQDGGNTFTTDTPVYRVIIDFEKNTADCLVYHPGFSENDSDDITFPNALIITKIPVKFNHSFYYLEAANPESQVLRPGSAIATESEDYTVKNFALTLTTTDLTQANISYTIGERRVNFSGASVVKASNPQPAQ